MAQMVKNLAAIQEGWIQSQGWEDSLEKGMITQAFFTTILGNQVFLPGEFHGQRSLAGYVWSRKESDTTESITLSL